MKKVFDLTDTIIIGIVHKTYAKCSEFVAEVTETLESMGVATTAVCLPLEGRAVSTFCATVRFSVPHDELRYIIATPVGMIKSTAYAEDCLKALAAKKLWYDTVKVKRRWGFAR